MSVKKILLFIVTCILLLAAVAFFFPKDGITLGDITLRFPDLKEMLSTQEEDKLQTPRISPEEQLAKMSKALEMKQLSELADSLAYYRQIFSTASVGIQFPYDDPSLFDGFFRDMENAQSEGNLVRVLHYGDSQIEQDRITSTLRMNWQERFGGMGCGMIPALQTIPTPFLKQEHGGDMHKYLVYSHEEFKAEHNQYGPMAQFVRVTDSARMTVSPRYANQSKSMRCCTQVKVLVANAQAGFRAILHHDGQWQERVISDSSAQLHMLQWEFEKPQENIDLSFWGNADIQAVLLDGKSGVAVDNIPMRGCSGTIFASIDKASLAEAYRLLDPRLVILEFGGNRMPMITSKDDIALYMRRLSYQIRYLKNLLPRAAFLFIGPADMACSVDGNTQTYPLLEELIEALRSTCMDNQVAFWDMYQVMGGRNTIIEWTKTQPALAAPDYIHFTVRGAQRIAGLLQQSFDICYDYYRFRQQHLDDSTMLQISRLDTTQNYRQAWEDLLEESRADSSVWNEIEEGLDSIFGGVAL